MRTSADQNESRMSNQGIRPARSQEAKNEKKSSQRKVHSGSLSPDEHTQTSTPDHQEREEIEGTIHRHGVTEPPVKEEDEFSDENDDDFPFNERGQRKIFERSFDSRKILSPFAGVKRPESKCSFCIGASDRFRLVRSAYQGGDQFGKST